MQDQDTTDPGDVLEVDTTGTGDVLEVGTAEPEPRRGALPMPPVEPSEAARAAIAFLPGYAQSVLEKALQIN